MPVITGAALSVGYHSETRSLGLQVDAADALEIAEQAGSAKAINIVLMGRLARYFDVPEDEWQKALKRVVPEKFLALNQKAFAGNAACLTGDASSVERVDSMARYFQEEIETAPRSLRASGRASAW